MHKALFFQNGNVFGRFHMYHGRVENKYMIKLYLVLSFCEIEDILCDAQS